VSFGPRKRLPCGCKSLLCPHHGSTPSDYCGKVGHIYGRDQVTLCRGCRTFYLHHLAWISQWTNPTFTLKLSSKDKHDVVHYLDVFATRARNHAARGRSERAAEAAKHAAGLAFVLDPSLRG